MVTRVHTKPSDKNEKNETLSLALMWNWVSADRALHISRFIPKFRPKMSPLTAATSHASDGGGRGRSWSPLGWGSLASFRALTAEPEGGGGT